MNVVIRADASSRVASGHVMRCKTLADELRQGGADVRFVCREQPGHLMALLSHSGYAVIGLPAAVDVDQSIDATQTIAALNGFQPDWLVVDHYRLDEAWESRLRSRVGRICVIDDLANRRHVCDLLVDQNWFGCETPYRYRGLVPEQSRCLLGSRYALLQPPFRRLRASVPSRDGRVQRILIFFGAVDSQNLTLASLQALQAPEFADLVLDIVVGHANAGASTIERLVAERPSATLHRDLPSLATLMAQADLMLGAGGATTWERCCLGLPAVVFAVADNQRRLTAALAAAGVHYSLGDCSSVTVADWTQAVHELREAPDRVRGYATSASRLTDGFGCLRVAAAMDDRPMEMVLRRAAEADEGLLLEWANDPQVRTHAFTSQSISPETHHAWFRTKLADPRCVLLIGEDARGLPVGQVRFDCDANEARVDISVDPALRGHGLGKTLLGRALEAFRNEGRHEQVVGEVLPDNHASCRVFLRLGFTAAAPLPGRPASVRFVLG